MIHEVLFPQTVIQEDEDPIFEINPCVTSYIKDLPQSEQDHLKSYKGNRLGHFRSFKLGNKAVGK